MYEAPASVPLDPLKDVQQGLSSKADSMSHCFKMAKLSNLQPLMNCNLVFHKKRLSRKDLWEMTGRVFSHPFFGAIFWCLP